MVPRPAPWSRCRTGVRAPRTARVPDGCTPALRRSCRASPPGRRGSRGRAPRPARVPAPGSRRESPCSARSPRGRAGDPSTPHWPGSRGRLPSRTARRPRARASGHARAPPQLPPTGRARGGPRPVRRRPPRGRHRRRCPRIRESSRPPGRGGRPASRRDPRGRSRRPRGSARAARPRARRGRGHPRPPRRSDSPPSAHLPSTTSALPASRSSEARSGRSPASSAARCSRPAAAAKSPRADAARPAVPRRMAAAAASSLACPSAGASSLAVAEGLLEVVADDLVVLGRRSPAFRASARSARGARRAPLSGGRGRRRRGSGDGGTGRRLRRRTWSGRAGSALLRTSVITCGRHARARRRPQSSRTAPRWKTLPSTDARSITSRSASPSLSIRAATSAWMVGGTGSERSSAVAFQRPFSRMINPSSTSMPSSSSMKSGLPSAAASTRSRASSSSSTRPSRFSTRRPHASVSSGSSRTEVALSFPPAQAGRRSRSSGREAQISRIGASRDQSDTCSTRSRKVGSAQWMSSNTTTSGCRRASASNSLRMAQAPSSRRPTPSRPTSCPESGGHDLGLGLACHERLERGSRLLHARVPAPQPAAHRLGERPEGDALSVGEAATAQERRARLHRPDELVHEP